MSKDSWRWVTERFEECNDEVGMFIKHDCIASMDVLIEENRFSGSQRPLEYLFVFLEQLQLAIYRIH